MNANSENIGRQPAWFVGAIFDDDDDQVSRFVREGIWEIQDPLESDSAFVKSMKIGDRIAIKSAYTRKRGLPFDNREQTVAVMAIKAIGTITENLLNGERVRVNWTLIEPPREWYFRTYQKTIWRVLPGEWMADAMIAFAFDGAPQDIERFRNAPYWRERFGTVAQDQLRFAWTKFYEAIADKLLEFRENRSALVAGIRKISQQVEGLGHLEDDQYADGTTGFVKDICPFTTMGLFNRHLKDSNRKAIAAALAKFLGVTEAVPESFEGIPLLNNQKSWYFSFEKDRKSGHIDALWDVFAAGIGLAASDDEGARTKFAKAFDSAMAYHGVAWNLTFGLYWIRPWSYLSLDGNSRLYVSKKLGISIGRNSPKKRSNAADYLAVMDALEPRFEEPSYPAHSFPELSLESWKYRDPAGDEQPDDGDEIPEVANVGQMAGKVGESAVRIAVPIVPYSVQDILNDGCFLERADIERLLERLQTKKNLILEGPPGTGKTWLAKRLAFAWMGQKDESKVRAVQFHPNLSYEDFVRGWRPTGEGKLSLVDGVFMEAVKAASKDPLSKVVVVIEEINRGNPAQIFGEMLTLLEAGKRTPNEALELCYPDADGKRRPVHIPENLYVIGTMNIADRSLAMVDLALRRRFAFVGLEPKLGNKWREWVVKECGVDADLATDIERRLVELNDQIAADARLGKQFRIGHSYVTPSYRLETGDTKKWFTQVVGTEIGPLLEEYWFDAQVEAHKACDRLVQGW